MLNTDVGILSDALKVAVEEPWAFWSSYKEATSFSPPEIPPPTGAPQAGSHFRRRKSQPSSGSRRPLYGRNSGMVQVSSFPTFPLGIPLKATCPFWEKKWLPWSERFFQR